MTNIKQNNQSTNDKLSKSGNNTTNRSSSGKQALETRAKNENKSVHQVASEMGQKGGKSTQSQNDKR